MPYGYSIDFVQEAGVTSTCEVRPKQINGGKMAHTYSCLGFHVLGMCAYNPTDPTVTYFTVGDAIAALGFTLAIQQLFKPIYRFRLRAFGLRFSYLAYAVLAGALCSFIALLLPNLPLSHDNFLEYPIAWEMIGGILIVGAYVVVASVSFRAARLHPVNLFTFVQAAAALLAEANDDDRVAFAQDLLGGRHNLERLIFYASAWQRAEGHETMIELERLRANGKPPSFVGRPPPSAFYRFAHREELNRASAASALLHILADPDFCSVLVSKTPWLTASALQSLADKKVYGDQAEPFIQEIARQSVIRPESMLAKEIGYTGFGSAPFLSSSLFENRFLLANYDPLSRLSFDMPKDLSDGFVRRLNSACQMMLETTLRARDYWPRQYMYNVRSIYEHIFRQWQFSRYNSKEIEYRTSVQFGIKKLYDKLLEDLSSLPWKTKSLLFIKDTSEYRRDLVHIVAEIVYDSIECISNNFRGFDDDAWLHVIDVFHHIYPQHGSQPEGMNPLQQQLAIKFIAKLRENMDGWYPSISRVLLAAIGPYDRIPDSSQRTAFAILRDAVYKEMQKLPLLQNKAPEKLPDFFPETIKYDVSNNTINHIFRDGVALSTALSELNIPEVILTDERNWELPNPAE